MAGDRPDVWKDIRFHPFPWMRDHRFNNWFIVEFVGIAMVMALAHEIQVQWHITDDHRKSQLMKMLCKFLSPACLTSAEY
jgi:hypothetical protein